VGVLKALYDFPVIERHTRETYRATGDLVATGYADQALRTYRGIAVSRLREEGVKID